MPARNLTYRPTAVCSLFTAHSSLAEIYSFSAKERDTETGLSVTSLRSVSSSSLNQTRTSSVWYSLVRRFGARYYSSDLSVWLSVDPMSGKYPSLSPYVYCADNPVRCVDPNGDSIVGTDNKAISYSYDDQGNVVWSKNASDDTKRIGKALLMTKKGTEIFNDMVNSDIIISLELSNEKRIAKNNQNKYLITFGECSHQTYKGKVVRAFVTIYLGTINEIVDNNSKYEFSEDSPHYMLSNGQNIFSVDEIIGAVAGHEGGHTTQENFNLKSTNPNESETVPNQNLRIIFEQLKEQKNNN